MMASTSSHCSRLCGTRTCVPLGTVSLSELRDVVDTRVLLDTNVWVRSDETQVPDSGVAAHPFNSCAASRADARNADVMSAAMAKLHWIDAYNFARVNPGQASAALLLAWPLFIAFAAVLVALSPVVFPGAMIASYVLKHTNAPAIEKPKPKASVGPGASYAEMYPEVTPKQNLCKCSFPVTHTKSIESDAPRWPSPSRRLSSRTAIHRKRPY